jgi:hypothetical protein
MPAARWRLTSNPKSTTWNPKRGDRRRWNFHNQGRAAPPLSSRPSVVRPGSQESVSRRCRSDLKHTQSWAPDPIASEPSGMTAEGEEGAWPSAGRHDLTSVIVRCSAHSRYEFKARSACAEPRTMNGPGRRLLKLAPFEARRAKSASSVSRVTGNVTPQTPVRSSRWDAVELDRAAAGGEDVAVGRVIDSPSRGGRKPDNSCAT